MGKWTRLTPEDESRENVHNARYLHIPDHVYPHHIDAGRYRRVFTDSELLNLIIATGKWQQVPEVIELADIAHILYEKIRHLSDDPQWAITAEDLDRLHKAITAVKEIK